MDTSTRTALTTFPTVAIAADGPQTPAAPAAVPPQVCIPMRAEVRQRLGAAALACGGASMLGFVIGGCVAAVVPMAPLTQTLVFAGSTAVPLMPTSVLSLLYYLSKPYQPNRPIRTHA